MSLGTKLCILLFNCIKSPRCTFLDLLRLIVIILPKFLLKLNRSSIKLIQVIFYNNAVDGKLFERDNKTLRWNTKMLLTIQNGDYVNLPANCPLSFLMAHKKAWSQKKSQHKKFPLEPKISSKDLEKRSVKSIKGGISFLWELRKKLTYLVCRNPNQWKNPFSCKIFSSQLLPPSKSQLFLLR